MAKSNSGIQSGHWTHKGKPFSKPMLEGVKMAIAKNLYPDSVAMFSGNLGKEWDYFPWHTFGGNIQTTKPHSSQALAISVFGTIAMLPAARRDMLLNEIALRTGIRPSIGWELRLEWEAPKSLLGEMRASQIEVMATSLDSLMFIECKFTESEAGRCTQPQPQKKNDNGRVQCNGNYELQTNPANGVVAKCALTGKGIRYWEFVPEVFIGIESASDHRPCPFKGEWYQWMRNLVLCYKMAQEENISNRAVLFAYADGQGLPMVKKLQGGYFEELQGSLRKGSVPIHTMSFQEIAEIARDILGMGGFYKWVCEKIEEGTRSWQLATGKV